MSSVLCGFGFGFGPSFLSKCSGMVCKRRMLQYEGDMVRFVYPTLLWL